MSLIGLSRPVDSAVGPEQVPAQLESIMDLVNKHSKAHFKKRAWPLLAQADTEKEAREAIQKIFLSEFFGHCGVFIHGQPNPLLRWAQVYCSDPNVSVRIDSTPVETPD